MLSDSEFIELTDRVLGAIGAAVDSAVDAADADLDWSLNDGVLTVDCGAAGKLIVNRHLPNRELWLAAKSGGFHFRGNAGAWRDSKSGEELAGVLMRLFRTQTGASLDLPRLPAPD